MWHDVKKELPNEGDWCLLLCEGVDEIFYRAARYEPNINQDNPWIISDGHFFDGKTILKWTVIFSYLMEQYNQETPYRPLNTKNWKDRLCIEYWQLSDKIENLEKTLNQKLVTDYHSKLLFEQREYMLKYKDVLFRRIYDLGIDLYKKKENEE